MTVFVITDPNQKILGVHSTINTCLRFIEGLAEVRNIVVGATPNENGVYIVRRLKDDEGQFFYCTPFLVVEPRDDYDFKMYLPNDLDMPEDGILVPTKEKKDEM